MAKKSQGAGLTTWESALDATIRSLQPGIVIETPEEPRALYSVLRVVAALNGSKAFGERDVLHWSAVKFQKRSAKNLEAVEPLEPQKFASAVLAFAEKDGEANSEGEETHSPSVLILSDPGAFLTDEQPTNIRALREAFWKLRRDGALKTIILMGEGIKLGEDVAADVWTTRFELPTASDLEGVLSPIIADYKVTLAGKVKFDDGALQHFTRACAGLPEDTARSLLSRSITRFLAVDSRAVTLAHEEKRSIVKRSGVATLKEPRGGMELVGGLTEFKKYIGEIDPLFQGLDSARKFGCRFPAGALLMGVPGTGKSLMAEALAGHWKLPMLTMEMGAMFGGLVGESESKLRKFQALAKAIKPCLVFADEIEKGIGGGGGENDGGTTERVKQSLLTWLQEKDDEIIVVATANRIEAFNSNPEFLRRFDSIWFVDLPDAVTRAEIAAIHVKRAGHEIPAKDLLAVATASKGHSGAEIEKAVQATLRRAFALGCAPTGAMLLEATKQIVPLSVTMAERIDVLRAYCKSGRALNAGPSLEADPKPVAKAPVVTNGKPSGPQI